MYDYVDGVEVPHGIAKFDLATSSAETAVAAKIGFGRGCSGGEAIFIPSSADPSALKGARDQCASLTDDLLLS